MTEVTISDKAQAITALSEDLDKIDLMQLSIAQEIGELFIRQCTLSQKSATLHKLLKVLIK